MGEENLDTPMPMIVYLLACLDRRCCHLHVKGALAMNFHDPLEFEVDSEVQKEGRQIHCYLG